MRPYQGFLVIFQYLHKDQGEIWFLIIVIYQINETSKINYKTISDYGLFVLQRDTVIIIGPHMKALYVIYLLCCNDNTSVTCLSLSLLNVKYLNRQRKYVNKSLMLILFSLK